MFQNQDGDHIQTQFSEIVRTVLWAKSYSPMNVVKLWPLVFDILKSDSNQIGVSHKLKAFMPWANTNAHVQSFMKVHYVFELCPGLKIGHCPDLEYDQN